MANGFPLSALAGRRDVMRLGGYADDADRVFLLSLTAGGQPWALAAMLAVIDTYEQEGIAEQLHSTGADLRAGVEDAVAAAGLSDYFQVRGRDCNLVYVARDADGRLMNVTYLNGALTVTYTYDSRDRLTRVRDSLTGAEVDFSYNDAGELIGIMRANGVNGTYTRDGAGRLKRIQEGNVIDLQYTLNAAGEVTAMPSGGILGNFPVRSRRQTAG